MVRGRKTSAPVPKDRGFFYDRITDDLTAHLFQTPVQELRKHMATVFRLLFGTQGYEGPIVSLKTAKYHVKTAGKYACAGKRLYLFYGNKFPYEKTFTFHNCHISFCGV